MGRIFTAVCVIAICFPVLAQAIAIRAIDLNAILTLFMEQIVSVITQTDFEIDTPPEPEQQPQPTPVDPLENQGGL